MIKTNDNDAHRTCHICRKRVSFPMWYVQRARKQKATCIDCVTEKGVNWTPPRDPNL